MLLQQPMGGKFIVTYQADTIPDDSAVFFTTTNLTEKVDTAISNQIVVKVLITSLKS